MKIFKSKTILAAICSTMLIALSFNTQAGDKFTLQTKWVTQAQFAGYYVALENGYYDDEGLDVTIKSGGPDIAPPQVMAGGGADILIEWMPAALASREKGLNLVNIAQPFKSSGMMLTCRKDSGISSPSDFADKTLGVWFYGNEYPFLSWMSKLNMATDGSAGGVTVLKQGWGIEPILQKQADCVSTMTYNEYWQVIDGGLSADELVVFPYDEQGVSTLEDGLYVLEENLTDPAFVDKAARFLRASMKGWEWASNNSDAAADIVLENDMSGAQTEKHQRRMMGEVNKLTANGGKLNVNDYQRTVDTLLGSDSDPVINGEPVGAWTHKVWDAAFGS
ncbi:ABC transporter substrate-binding protein [Candidatus Pseudothioglobus singularis]|nr:ABC transporter substrate-binding protein [Candidatus Pseudothioglobus singularis]MDC0630272.1 ABC transporter substrate-binding protein [bacterium]MDG1166311.1 ABC transporter substrate-binding protein [Candidatus Thioglobus sp.]MDC0596152.1 ABC transporter substrate-binding protein [Candidatus Pseudothioglobus singularis]MDC0599480.1 ABC transporter substrate-binding protein [Candidatus Pseudothioglobus singularis]